jgi:hypothetical protein
MVMISLPDDDAARLGVHPLHASFTLHSSALTIGKQYFP